MRVAWTGTRPPPGGFSAVERARIAQDVQRVLLPGDEVGIGVCNGVDELVAVAASLVTFEVRLVGFVPANKAAVSQLALDLCHEVHDDGRTELERDQDLVDWCTFLHAVPLYPVEQRARGLYHIIRQPRSGTGFTMRRGQEAHKLRHILVLRPPSEIAV